MSCGKTTTKGTACKMHVPCRFHSSPSTPSFPHSTPHSTPSPIYKLLLEDGRGGFPLLNIISSFVSEYPFDYIISSKKIPTTKDYTHVISIGDEEMYNKMKRYAHLNDVDFDLLIRDFYLLLRKACDGVLKRGLECVKLIFKIIPAIHIPQESVNRASFLGSDDFILFLASKGFVPDKEELHFMWRYNRPSFNKLLEFLHIPKRASLFMTGLK